MSIDEKAFKAAWDVHMYRIIEESALRAFLKIYEAAKVAEQPGIVSLEKTAVAFQKRVKPNESWHDLTVIEREFWRDRVETVLDAAGVRHVD